MITLFVGGARSGKSAIAERFTSTLGPTVTYVATWTAPAGQPVDPAMQARIAAHQARRPHGWALEEVGSDLPAVLSRLDGTVLVDSLGTWVAGVPDFAVDTAGLCRALAARRGDTVVVSEEVGLGVHPSTSVGREFRDALGRVNEAVADVAEDVWLVVAGRTLPLSRVPWGGLTEPEAP